jgi:hypothetical protein
VNEKPKFEVGFESDASKQPQRVVFITKKTSAKVKGEVSPQLMSYPHVILREAIAFQILTVILVIVSLFWDAPLEQLADPLLTPNPAKAPWYFLGLQELLHYFPPVVGGVLMPTLVVLALVVVPYFDVNIEGEPLWSDRRRRRFPVIAGALGAVLLLVGLFQAWTVIVPSAAIALLVLLTYFLSRAQGRAAAFLRSRPVPWWVMTWFIGLALTLTIVGTFFRGPGWSWVWPWK